MSPELKTFRLPLTFWRDHYDRCADHPGTRKEGDVRNNQAIVWLDDLALDDLVSDALHYARGGVDEAPAAIVKSAQLTVGALLRAGVELRP